MEDPVYDSPRALKLFLEGRGYSMQKKFGQNFLVNPSARRKIVDLAGIRPGDLVWEIGPGLGALTHHLAALDIGIVAFEIDRGFADILRELFGRPLASSGPSSDLTPRQAPVPRPARFRLVEGDFLKTWKADRVSGGEPDVVIGNLPYNAAGAFMADFATEGFRPRRMVFTVQKEGAERMRARVDAESYSSFSVLCQSLYRIKAEFDLSAGSFWPAPDVTSSVISLEPRDDFPPLADRGLFLSLTRTLFSSRRKTVRNNLKSGPWPLAACEQALAALGIDPSARAETLSPERIAALANALGSALGETGIGL